MIRSVLFIALFASLTFVGCSAQDNKIIGKWKGTERLKIQEQDTTDFSSLLDGKTALYDMIVSSDLIEFRDKNGELINKSVYKLRGSSVIVGTDTYSITHIDSLELHLLQESVFSNYLLKFRKE